MNLEIDHIAIAVSNLDESLELWKRMTGATLVGREHVAAQDTNVAFLLLGNSRIELIAPSSPESTVARFLAKRGPGLHHLALKTEVGQIVLNTMAESGAKLIDQKLRQGAEDCKVGFVHPSTFGGVLVEIVEHPERT